MERRMRSAGMPVVRPSAVVERYWRAARAPRYSLLFALPLLVLYEALALLLRDEMRGVRNGADVMLKGLAAAVVGRDGPLAVLGIAVVAGAWLVWRDLRTGGGLRGRIFLGMATESIALALVFGLAVGTVTAQILHPFGTMAIAPIETLGPMSQLVISLGAGIYEELVFRVLLVGLLAWSGRAVFRWRARTAGIVAAVVGALLFSAVHYIGAYGDPLELGSFTFRFVGGLAFSAMYLTRGFGITAWTHALYDVFLLVV
jgi:membrane protease YdiL (CAAX protease family)